MEELQKACETLAEAWNKALEPMEKSCGGTEQVLQTVL
jgi:hypothetical protein